MSEQLGTWTLYPPAAGFSSRIRCWGCLSEKLTSSTVDHPQLPPRSRCSCRSESLPAGNDFWISAARRCFALCHSELGRARCEETHARNPQDFEMFAALMQRAARGEPACLPVRRASLSCLQKDPPLSRRKLEVMLLCHVHYAVSMILCHVLCRVHDILPCIHFAASDVMPCP